MRSDGRHILWVEDDANQRKIITEFFEILGYRGRVAKNGVEALELLAADRYHILITDIGMPEMNGWQLIDRVKSDYGDRMKIVVVSGWALEIDAKKQADLGIETVISKPFLIADIRRVLEE